MLPNVQTRNGRLEETGKESMLLTPVLDGGVNLIVKRSTRRGGDRISPRSDRVPDIPDVRGCDYRIRCN